LQLLDLHFLSMTRLKHKKGDRRNQYNTLWSSLGRTQNYDNLFGSRTGIIIHIIHITGSTDSNITANDFVDQDTVLLEIILRANPDSSAASGVGFTVKATFDTAETMDLLFDMSTDIYTTLDDSGVNKVYSLFFFV